MATVQQEFGGIVVAKTKTKGDGKSVAWSSQENNVWVRAAAAVLLDPAVGSSMNNAEKGRRIRSAFISDRSRPASAGSTRDCGELDSRRWDGRSPRAVIGQWDIVRRECTKFHACMLRVKAVKLTGNPTDEELLRCSSLIYSDGSQSISHLYDCVRNPHYHIAKPFKYFGPYSFLSTQTPMLAASGVAMDDEKETVKRPIGVKAAKKLKAGDNNKRMGKVGDKEGVEESILRMEKMMSASMAERKCLAERKLALQRHKMEWDMAKMLMGPGSDASLEERSQLSRLLRKRLYRSLDENSSASAALEICAKEDTRDSQSNADGVTALLGLSGISASFGTEQATASFPLSSTNSLYSAPSDV